MALEVFVVSHFCYSESEAKKKQHGDHYAFTHLSYLTFDRGKYSAFMSALLAPPSN